jgi:hypothetical protein
MANPQNALSITNVDVGNSWLEQKKNSPHDINLLFINRMAFSLRGIFQEGDPIDV